MTAGRPLPDTAVAALVGAAVLGAWLAHPAPRLVAVALIGMALWRRWSLLLVLAVGVGASGQAAAAWDGVAPARAHAVVDVVTLLGDPRPIGRSIVVDVRHDGHRYAAWFDAGEHGSVVDRLAGEQLSIVGQAKPRAEEDAWLAPRGVVGEIDVESVRWWRPGSRVTQVANGLRRTLQRGVEGLPDTHRSLVMGFVLGDDRFQSDLVTDDFRGSGLGHLLAVSGQNVAFLLVLSHPVLSRLAFRHRLPFTVAIIAFFALLTRFEPSVLRASAMAALSATAAASGQPVLGRRLLALSVVGLVLFQPLLIHALAFQLSVLASAGILWLGPPIAAALPGPESLALALAVTVAAQLAVSPLVLVTFGDVPVAALPANVAAAPAAGPISAWVLTGGIVAGVAGEPLATILHLPTRLLVSWVALVARWGSRAPLGQIGWVHLTVLVVAVAVILARPRLLVRRLLAVAVVVVLSAPAVASHAPPPYLQPTAGVELWRAGGATVVRLDSAVRPADGLAALRRSGVRRIDLLIASDLGGTVTSTIEGLRRRYRVDRVWSPGPLAQGVSQSPSVGQRHRLGSLVVTVTGAESNGLAVSIERLAAAGVGVGSDRAPRARSPPPLRRHHPGSRDGHPQPHPRLLLRRRPVLRVR